jgi:hypothetical protein
VAGPDAEVTVAGPDAEVAVNQSVVEGHSDSVVVVVKSVVAEYLGIAAELDVAVRTLHSHNLSRFEGVRLGPDKRALGNCAHRSDDFLD